MNLKPINEKLNSLNASQIIQWSATTFDEGLIMTTSFGIQSAVMLHLVTQIIPDIPVIWVDTGYLPAETYSFAEELTKRLKLNLHTYQSHLSPARMEAIYGKLWEQDDVHSLNRYHYLRKVEPMKKALKDFKAVAWLAGLRRDQTDHRQKLQIISYQEEQYKILPILAWNSRDIYHYLKQHNLPYHPLFDQGYVSVGDWHSSRPLQANDLDERDTRFGGLKQECGLHLNISA